MMETWEKGRRVAFILVNTVFTSLRDASCDNGGYGLQRLVQVDEDIDGSRKQCG
jgi:hypothetical protein